MAQSKRLLVVDDDVDFADSLADLLGAEGFEVSVAYDGHEAVRRMREDAFDVTIIDVQMPGQSGVESLQEILRIRPSARVLMMTGYSMPALLDSAIAAGAAAVVDKPLDLDKLRLLIEQRTPTPVVLVADDDAEFVESLRSMLESSGYTVMAAASGREAIERATARAPDVMLLDLRMPGMSGVDTYRELSRRGLLPPTIVLSAYLEEERGSLDGLPGLRADHIVGKPVNGEHLLALMSRLSAAR
jgi:CheY-like chemotaxis protein